MTRTTTNPIGPALRRMKSLGPLCAFNNARMLALCLERLYDEFFDDVGLTASQVALLWTIHATQPVSLGNLAGYTGSDQTTVSRTVGRASALGLVQSQRAAGDRRVRLVRLTALGKRRLVIALPRWRMAQWRIAAASPEIVPTLRKLAAISRSRLGAQGKTHAARVKR